jgi:hypothetical protein
LGKSSFGEQKTIRENAKVGKPKIVTCSKCPLLFPRRGHLHIHYSRSHFRQQIFKKYGRQKKCPICAKGPFNSESFLSHMGMVHGEVDRLLESEARVLSANQTVDRIQASSPGASKAVPPEVPDVAENASVRAKICPKGDAKYPQAHLVRGKEVKKKTSEYN